MLIDHLADQLTVFVLAMSRKGTQHMESGFV